MATLHNLNHKLVSGFIHTIQKSFSNNYMVPIDVINIIISYYIYTVQLFIYSPSPNKTISSTLHLLKTSSNQLSLCNISRSCKPPFCYIPHFPKSNLSSIFCVRKECPTFVPFKTKNNTFHSKYIFRSKQTLKQSMYASNTRFSYRTAMDNYKPSLPTHFIYCGNKHGIICPAPMAQRRLYQMKLENIKIQKKNFKFEAIEKSKFLEPNYTIMYLKQSETIFGIEHFAVTSNCGGYFNQTEQIATCAVFDLNENKWTKLHNMDFIQNEYEYKFESCNHQNDENIIIAVANTGFTSRYHFKVDKWENIIGNVMEFGCENKRDWRYVVWMEANNLVGVCDGKYFGYLDIRDNKRKWMKQENMSNVLQEVGDGNENVKFVFC